MRLSVSKGQNLLASVVLALYAVVALALALAPVSLTGRGVPALATVGDDAGRALSYGNTWLQASPFSWAALYLEALGVEPRRAEWHPNGVNYGNTRLPLGKAAAPITVAWEYRPAKLDAVPPGVNALAPTWFYVQDGKDGAEVVDIAHVSDHKNTKWDPAQYVAQAHGQGAQVWATVVSFEPKLSKQIVTDPDRQAAFLTQLVDWVGQYNLDGISFDFENMDPADKEAFTALVAATKAKLGQGKVVSVSVTVPLNHEDPDNWWQCYDRKSLGEAADYVAVMAYDNPAPEPPAPLDWVEDRVEATLDEVPSEKLLLGVPFYGVDVTFDLPPGVLTGLPELGEAKGHRTMLPSQLAALLSADSYESNGKPLDVKTWLDRGTWMEDYGITRYAFTGSDGLLHVIYCEQDRSIAAKGGLAWFNRLGGVAVWRMSYGNEGLWQALQQGLEPNQPVPQ